MILTCAGLEFCFALLGAPQRANSLFLLQPREVVGLVSEVEECMNGLAEGRIRIDVGCGWPSALDFKL